MIKQTMSKQSNPRLLPSHLYLSNLTTQVIRAQKRIVLVAMVFFNDSDRLESLVEALCEAAKRGVKVTVCADSFTYLEPKGPWRHIIQDQSSQAYRAIRTERRLKNAGVNFHWLGRNAIIGAIGRTHAKWSVVDDVSYSFGGVNLSEINITNVDYMFRINQQPLADFLTEQTEWLIKSDQGSYAGKNKTLSIDSQSVLLLDGGLPFHSMIYNRAVALAKQATSALFVSQYCPTGRLARALRQKNSRLYFNHWEYASKLNTVFIRFGMRVSQFQTLYNRESYLHAKFIIYTMPDGTKIALTGSHNFFAHGGVVAGTREIALETSDQSIIASIESFFEQNVS